MKLPVYVNHSAIGRSGEKMKMNSQREQHTNQSVKKLILYTGLFDKILEDAMVSPRLRMHYDLRTQATDSDPLWRDSSQRMLNVMMKDTVIPIHRHAETTETVIVLKGSGDEVIYDDKGVEIDEDGTVIFEAKDRAYDPIKTEEFL